MFAGAEALRTEYKTITDAGLFVQIDDAHLPFTYDRMVPPASPTKEFRKWARIRVDALNHALRGIPEERVRYHICWGSWNGPHSSDVPLKEIVDLILKVRAARTRSRPRTRVTSTSGRYGRTSSCPPARS